MNVVIPLFSRVSFHPFQIGEKKQENFQVMFMMEKKNSHDSLHQFQCLLETLSELDEKIMTMVSTIEEAKAEEESSIHSELIKMGKEFHNSYRLCAEGYDKLNTASEQIISESLSFKYIVHGSSKEIAGSAEEIPMDMWGDLNFEVLKLIAENQSQLDELVRRNEAKRDAIKDLHCKLEEQTKENQALQEQLKCSKQDVHKHQSLLSKLKQMILGKPVES